MKHPILYSFKRCPYAMRARMAFYLSNIKCEIREVSLRNKPKEMIRISPKATVPVLENNNEVLDESMDIINWIIKKNNPFIVKQSNADQRFVESTINLFDKKFKFHLDRYKYATRYKNEDPINHRNSCLKILVNLENKSKYEPWFYGAHIDKIDISILPFIRQFRIADEEWFDSLNSIPNIQKWLIFFLDSDIFKNIMISLKPWVKKDEPIIFP